MSAQVTATPAQATTKSTPPQGGEAIAHSRGVRPSTTTALYAIMYSKITE